MDALDVRIIREVLQGQTLHAMQPEVRKSFRAVAAKLTVDEDTVRGRIRRLLGTGFLRPWPLFVNPTLAGLRPALAVIDVSPPSSKKDIVRKLGLVPGVVVLHNYFGSSLSMVFHYESESSFGRLVDLILGLSNARDPIIAKMRMPECRIQLTPSDWRIITALWTDPRKSFASVAKEVSLSDRTVKRRLERLTAHRVLLVIGSADPKALKGTIWADLTVFYGDDDSFEQLRPKLIQYLDEYYFHVAPLLSDRPGHLGFGDIFHLLVPGVAKAQEILNWVKERSAVKSARIDLLEDRLELYELYHQLMEDRLQDRWRVPPTQSSHKISSPRNEIDDDV